MAHFSYRLRRLHRFLGVSIGIQLLLWTISGLYFSWTNLNDVHGDPLKKAPEALITEFRDTLGSPAMALNQLNEQVGDFDLTELRLVNILGEQYWQMTYITAEHREHRHKEYSLADAQTGALRPPLTEQEAVELAKQAFNATPTVKQVEHITATDEHHEFRESPLPAYAVHFEHPTQTTVYVSTELGTVQKFRNDQWRVFDFLWMFHTMDYRSRDNFNNWVLRLFSVLGLVTVCSGFLLFFVTMRRKRGTET